MEAVFANTPVWVWFVVMAALGAATVFTYWRCHARENTRRAADALAALAAEPVPDDDLLSPRRAGTEAEGARDPAPAPEPNGVSPEALSAMRYRTWALETRLRQALEAARAGRPLNAAALEDGLDELVAEPMAAVEGVDAGELSALRYRNWLLENQLKRAAAGALLMAQNVAGAQQRSPEGVALSDPGGGYGAVVAAPESDRVSVALLHERLERTIAAAKMGRVAELAEIEREMTAQDAADNDGGVDAAALSPALSAPLFAVDFAGDGTPGGLRYRNWLLAASLRRTLDAVRSGGAIDADAVEADLRRATAVAEPLVPIDANGFPLSAANGVDGAAPAVEPVVSPSAASPDEDAEEGASRYRVWRLRRALGLLATAAEAGARIDRDAIDAALRSEVGSETAQDAVRPIAPEGLTQDAALAALGARPTETPASDGSAAQLAAAEAAAAALRARVTHLEDDARQVAHAVREQEAARETAQQAEQAAQAEAAAARSSEAVAKAALASAQSQLAANLSALEADGNGLRSRLSSALEDASALRARLAQAEGGLRRVRGEAAAAEAARVGLASAAASAAASSSAAEAEASALRGRLWTTEWRLRQTGDAVRPRQEQEASRLEAAEREVLALRERLKQAEGLVGDLRSARASATTLRSRLWVADQRLGARRDAEVELSSVRTRLTAAEAEAAEAAEAASKARAAGPDPALTAEIETLRDRLARLEAEAPSAEELAEQKSEAEGLRSRLALAESEIGRLRGQISRGHEKLSGQVSMLTQVRSARKVGVTRAAKAALNVVASQTAVSHAAEVEAQLKALRETPLSGVESAAQELIDAGSVTAIAGNRPASLLPEADAGPPDDLKLIGGVSERIEALMWKFGLFYFSQLAEFNPHDLAWVDDRLALRGQVVRGRWSPQARLLADLKTAGHLAIGAEGTWTVGQAAPQKPVSAVVGAAEETIETVPPHPDAVDVTAPLSGAEAAALELIENPEFAPSAEARPPELEDLEQRGGPADFTVIRGLGPTLDAMLKAHGVITYAALAELSPEGMAWLDRVLGLEGRVVRDRWTPQARHFADLEAAAEKPPAAGRRVSADLDVVASEAARSASEPSAFPALGSGEPTVDAANADGRDDVDEAAEALLDEVASGARSAEALPPPEGLVAEPGAGASDDLTLIAGVDGDVQGRLNRLGVHSFGQIAALDAGGLAWVDAQLGLGGGAARAAWRGQARALATQKADGALQIGADGRWTVAGDAPLSDVASVAKASPFGRSEIDAMRLINGGYQADAGNRPGVLLDGQDPAGADDLTLIDGVGQKLAQALNDVGLFYFRQISALKAEELAWLDAKLRLKGRVVRDRWVAQASELQRRRRQGAA